MKKPKYMLKPTLMAYLCGAALTLIACKPHQPPSPVSSFSHNTYADIKADLAMLLDLSRRQNQESAVFQQEALSAIHSGSSTQINQVIEKMQQQVKRFNQQLQSLLLSSTEIDLIRNKMIQNNQLSLALAQEGASAKPNSNKIENLQQQLATTQTNIQQLIQQAQAQISQNMPTQAAKL